MERTTLFVALVKLDSAKAEAAARAFSRILNRFQSQLRRSLTYDQGSEMCHHKLLTQATGVTVYFAHPHSPWERGIMENTNGLLRQYLPKSTDLSSFAQQQLDDIACRVEVWRHVLRLVSRPRHFERRVRISRATLSCRLLVKAYTPSGTGAAFASVDRRSR